ncbi:heparinase II/III domain-containing protein [Pedobacter sp. SL55]|uniref:heparinase II/III domain-containing protein n=1 Tax=Pedobacter sp. SL55 TaxID=2995161 RepID=UPI00227133A4|nr:heparinase II/III family protein [Pedobacter sp. SL55]WAC41290.1 heparinase II/III family protein [Pedobacter sp. SL55]
MWHKINSLSATQKAYYINLANKANEYEWPSITASLYLDYKHTGRRVDFENLHNKRQEMISLLAIGAMITNDDTYIPQLVNGLWLLLEESTWVAPAHIVVQKQGADLPAVSTSYIDLHASRTGYRVALIHFLLKDKLEKYSKVINQRIAAELDRRIIKPYLENNRFFWMGLNGGVVNNWNAFNNANCFNALIYSQVSADTLKQLAQKIILSSDAFLNHYPADGGCDEGPSYWDMAGGRLINLLGQLKAISANKIDFAENKLLHNMGTYTYKMHISDKFYTNFADAHAVYTQNPVSIFQYGQMFNDEKLKEYAAFVFGQRNKEWGNDVIDFVDLLKVHQDLAATTARAPYPKYTSLPNLQVYTGREQEGANKGLFFAIKGGHNNESHNHNDIGNFIVYADGNPLLIDVGVGTYTSKTFSKQRYEIWNVQSNWHNCPTINGFEQKEGRKYAASNLKETHNNNVEQISMDISKSYPVEAAIAYWNREILLNRSKKQITITDKFGLNKVIKNNELNFISAIKPSLTKGKLNFADKASLHFDATKFDVVINPKIMDDDRLINAWGSQIFQIKLIARNKLLKDNYQIIIR